MDLDGRIDNYLGDVVKLSHFPISQLFFLRSSAAPRETVPRRPLATTTIQLPFASRHFEWWGATRGFLGAGCHEGVAARVSLLLELNGIGPKPR